jgi:hypothetical protein
MQLQSKHFIFIVACVPGSVHDGDDNASSRQNGTPASRWSSSGKVADFYKNNNQDGLLPVPSSDDPWSVNKAEKGICISILFLSCIHRT